MNDLPKEKPQWFKEHEDLEKAQIPLLVEEALTNFVEKKGKLSLSIIVTSAVTISSLVAIIVGIKTIFAWIGISIIKP